MISCRPLRCHLLGVVDLVLGAGSLGMGTVNLGLGVANLEVVPGMKEPGLGVVHADQEVGDVVRKLKW